jgi:hypothetical protein
MSEDISFPLLYCNGDSYSNHRYHPSLLDKTYVNFVAKSCQGFVINKSISGCCNRRIIRTTLHDMILQRKLNPTQKIIALIGLTFELRSELWIDDINSSIRDPEESNFGIHSFSSQINWRENLLQDKNIDTKNLYKLENKFFEQFSRGRAYFYSPYAERINLLADLIMLKSVDSLDIQFLIFQSPKAESLKSDYLLDFFKTQLSNEPRIFNLENFGFLNWCHEKKFIPLDHINDPLNGHYGSDAHQAFAEQILIPKLKELSIL